MVKGRLKASSLLARRFGGVLLFYLLILGVTMLTRVVLGVGAFNSLNHKLLPLGGTLLCGLLYDLAFAAYATVPLVVYLLLAPRRWLASRWHRGLMWSALSLSVYFLLFVAAAEWFFWDEFAARFNFIAVDYLIYTNEVIGNIRESYPMPAIFGGLAAVTAAIVWAIHRTGWMQACLNHSTDGWRWRTGLALLTVPVVFQFTLTNRAVPEFKNTYNQELARNGQYAFFAAFWENSLDYNRFYQTVPAQDAYALLRHQLSEANSGFRSPDLKDITRSITNSGPEQHWNVIQITVESLSASFLGSYGNTNHLTPTLDQLMREGLTFTNIYATGTRTVRGMEALTLCVPPTPGQSIVRRPHNDHLFTVGSVFQTRGYDTAFIYSGFGYFDSMNSYFAGNGYRVIDRSSIKKEEITYATVWGACDEDLYHWTIGEADQAFAAGKPFYYFLMTTSNHRPYGFPAGKIDLPTGGRAGAVKYTDYAIGQLLTEARTHPWFTNTLFVIVADHCASAAGKTALPVQGYRIPALVWNPLLVRPQTVGTLCSQIDLPPTLLGLMGWTYESRFYGKDVLKQAPGEERAFISTYQKLGYLQHNRLAVLEPVKQGRVFDAGSPKQPLSHQPDDPQFYATAITAYQTASELFAQGLNQAPETPRTRAASR